jgi:uncharacterized repeat protein (TIGR02543 family)
MNRDRGTSGRPRNAQVLLNVLVAVALVALGSVGSMPAASAGAGGEESAAAWPARWTDYTQADGKPIGDADGDVTPSTVDLVSGACPTCADQARGVAWASDGSNAFFRIRLGTDLTKSPERNSLEEAFLVQIADKSGTVGAVVGVNRTGAHQTVYVSDAVGDVVIKVHESPQNARDLAPLGVRVVRAADGSGQFFLDFQVPLSVIATVSGGAIIESTPIRLYYGSSAAASLTTKDLATITGDFMLGNVDAVDFSTLATVKLEALQHEVTIDSAGGTDMALQTVAEGFAAVPPATPTRTGHTFTGWFASAAGGPAYDFSAAVVGATTIQAHWSRNSYLVTFHSVGGSAVADQTVPYGDTVALAADPTRHDDIFLGWFTASTGGKPLVSGTRPVTGRTALYAHWRESSPEGVHDLPVDASAPPAADAPAAQSAQSAKPGPGSYSVEFHSHGGSAVADQLVASGATAMMPAPPTRDGFAFGAWFTAAKGGIKEDFTTPIAGATTLHARWTRTANPVVFYPNGGSAVDSQTVASGDTAAVPAEPTRAGYAFAGWFADAGGDEEWDFTVPIDEATTLYAHWTADADGTPDEPGAGAGDPDSGNNGNGDQDGDSAGQGGEHNGGAALPNTGNQVPEALVPAAVMLLLFGFVLMTRDRRRAKGRGATGPE